MNKYGYKPFCIGSQLAIAIGLILFACAPWIAPNKPFLVFALATAIFSAAAGLLEVLLSPITKSVPSDNSEANFMMMHTAFAGGIFAAALVTSLLLRLLGNNLWQYVVFLWALLPLYNTIGFIRSPMPGIVPVERRMKLGPMLRNPVFIVAFLAIFLAQPRNCSSYSGAPPIWKEGSGSPRLSETWSDSVSSPPCWRWPVCCT